MAGPLPRDVEDEIARLCRRVADLEAELELTHGKLAYCLTRYDALFEEASDAGMLVRPDGYIERGNRRLMQIVGLTEDQLKTQRESDVLHPLDEAPVEGLQHPGRLRLLLLSGGGRRVVDVTRQSFAGGYSQLMLRDITDQVNALKALVDVKANLEEAQARAHLGSWELHLDTLTGYWSKEMFRLFDRDPSEGIPDLETFMEYLHPEDQLRVRDIHLLAAQSAPGSPSFQIEYRTRALEVGEERLLRAQFYKRSGQPGKAPVLVGTTLDITELARAERAALEREESIRATLHSIGDAVIATDRSGRVTRMNPVAEKLTGWSIEEVHGQPLEGIFRIFNAKTGEPAESPVERVLETGEIVGLANDTILIARDGTTYQIADSGAPIRDRQGQVSGVVLVFRDVTQEYRLQQQLREHVRKRSEAHNFLVNILDAIPVRVFWKNREGVYKGGNIRFAHDVGLGHPGQLVGKTEADMPWRDDAEAIAGLEWHILEEGESFLDFEESRLLADGEERVLRTSRVPLRDLNGDIVGVLGLYEDITASLAAAAEGERLEAQLRQAQKLETIGTLAGGIAHDFNNILTPILGYSDLGMALIQPDAPGSKEFHEIHAAARRARDLVRQILAFSRQVDRDLRPVDLSALVDEVLALLRPIIPAHIRIVSDLAHDVPAILADASEVHQILVNLCTNAYQAMEQGGDLHISLKATTIDHVVAGRNVRLHPGPYAVLSVRDTGVGMDEAVLTRIFEPFFTTKPVNEGTGLGLSVAYGLVRNLGGALTVSSSPGEGTTFYAYFPVNRAGEKKGPAPTSGPASRPAGRREAILVVDDEAAVRDVIHQMLLRLGYQPVSVAGSTEAIAYLEAHPGEVDLILTDLTMPQLSGTALAQHVEKAYPDIPVILMTGFGESLATPAATTRATLSKPVVLDELAASVRHALDHPANTGGNTR